MDALEAMRQAREALRTVNAEGWTHVGDALAVLNAAIAQAEQAQPVATVTECEACFTPDMCQLRGTCDHYSAERLRVAAAQAEQAQPVRCPRCWEPILAAPVATVTEDDLRAMLPKLNDDENIVWLGNGKHRVVYTGDQMLAYGRAIVRAAAALGEQHE